MNIKDVENLRKCTQNPWYFMTNFVYTMERKDGIVQLAVEWNHNPKTSAIQLISKSKKIS